MIHRTAIIAAGAKLDPTVVVGPYAVIDAQVEIGPGCVVGPYVYITGQTRIGAHNRFYAGAVIGEAPQDVKYGNESTGLAIGNNNIFREHVTVHRSNKVAEETIIGSDNFLMAHCHVAHNCSIGNATFIANGALLGGHVSIADRAFISGNCLVHQFVRVGTLAFMQGGSAISKDLPPYTVARGDNGICGLNTVGLRRAGLTSAERLELRQLYHALFRRGLNLRAALFTARNAAKSEPARILLDFLMNAKRGVCVDTGNGGVKLDVESDEDSEMRP